MRFKQREYRKAAVMNLIAAHAFCVCINILNVIFTLYHFS